MAAQVHEFTMEMTCEGCSNAASRVLGKLGDKVSDVNVDLATKKITVTSAMTSEELTEVLKKTGKEIKHISSKSV